jgi:hypothetical protein
LSAYEFLGVAEAWEERWLPEVREYEKLTIYPPSVRGAVGVVHDVAAFAWRRARRRLVVADAATSGTSGETEAVRS